MNRNVGIITNIKFSNIVSLIFFFFLFVFICSYIYRTFSGSHLEALIFASPLSLIVFVPLAILYSILPFYFSNYNKLTLLLLFILIAPIFGELYFRFLFQLLFMSFLIWDLSHSKEIQSPRYNLFGILIIFVYLTSLIKTFFKEINFSLLLPLLSSESEASILEALSLSGLESFNSIIYAFEFIQLWKLGEIIIGSFQFHEFEKALARAFRIYVPILPFFLILQIKNLFPIFSLNQNAFWVFTERYSGTFSDPNAFGLMSGVLIILSPFVLRSDKIFYKISFPVILFLCSLWSGSRTFFLFLILGLILFFYRALRRKGFSFIKLLATIVSIITALIIALFFLIQIPTSTPSLNRLKSTMDPDLVIEMLESRTIYSQLALQAVKENPITGLGLGQFYREQERLSVLSGIDLNNWRDNANNFYLQIAAEAGVPSLLLVIFSFYIVLSPRKCSDNSIRYLHGVLFILFLSLLTGPHIHFLEVRLIIFLLIVFSLMEKTTSEEVKPFYPYICTAFIIIFALTINDCYSIANENLGAKVRGLYEIEKDEKGDLFRWTTSQANFTLCEGNNGFIIRSPLHELLESKNLHQVVIIKYQDVNGENFSERIKIEQRISEINLGGTNGVSVDRKNVSLSVNTISLRRLAGISDPRLLGVQILWGNSHDCL